MIIEAPPPFLESDITTWSDADNQRATAELESLFGAEPGTPGWYRMDVLADLIEAYEAVHYPFPPRPPVHKNGLPGLPRLTGREGQR